MKSRLFLVLIAMVTLALFSSLSVPAAAATPTVDLVLGSSEAIPWSIGGILPGSSGSQTVTLSNVGSQDGVVTIWISDIVNNEGLNPEPESGNTAEPGELGDYLILNVSGTNAVTNFTLPAKITDFPTSAADAKYIHINPLKAFSTLSVKWDWELPLATGNDVQGDRLSCTVNYMLEELASSPPPSQGGGGGSPSTPTPLPDMVPGATMSLIDSSDPVAVGDEFDYNIQLTNQSGIKDIHNLKLTGIIPSQMAFVSASGPAVFTVVGQEVRFSPVAVLQPAEKIDYQIRVRAMAAGDAVFVAAMRSDEFRESVSRQEGTTVFNPEAAAILLPPSQGIIAEVGDKVETVQNDYEISNLTANMSQDTPGADNTVTYEVTNTSGHSGEFRVIVSIPGLLETSQWVYLEAGQTKTMILTLPSSETGTYQMDIGGVQKTIAFGALPPAIPALTEIQQFLNSWLLLGILVVIGAAGLIYILIRSLMARSL